jgi:lysophospholipase L1-like esterase
MSKHENFIVEIPVNDEKAMEEFQKAMDDYHDEMNRQISEEAHRLGIAFLDMSTIWYLRSRSRWTQEKEDHLIKLAQDGKPLPNVLAGEF